MWVSEIEQAPDCCSCLEGAGQCISSLQLVPQRQQSEVSGRKFALPLHSTCHIVCRSLGAAYHHQALKGQLLQGSDRIIAAARGAEVLLTGHD